MGWITKILRRFSARSFEEDGDVHAAVMERSRLLKTHVTIQLQKARDHSPLVPRRFLQDCERLFLRWLDDIAKKTLAAELRQTPENHRYSDTDSGVYMVVSLLSWTTEEAVSRLAQASPEKPFGYVAMMTNLFLNNWPSADLTHFFHVLLCLGGNTFQMHTAMGAYGGFPKAKHEFLVLPVDLLNEEERRMTRL